jgi:hypothetical protein
MKRGMTREEKAAKKMAAVVTDLTLDLEMTGTYIAYEQNVVYNRMKVVLEAAEYVKENKNERD